MKCMLCGTQNQAEAQRCKGCGASLSDEKPAPFGAKTKFEGGPFGQDGSEFKKPQAGERSKTRFISPNDPNESANKVPQTQNRDNIKKTRFVEASGEPQNNPGKADVGPLAGFLVTFTWDAGGTWFPIREGKNVYGSSEQCDGHVESDRAMSGEHFAIMCRKGELRVRDLESTNATNVDGTEVWSGLATIAHGSIIKAGDTTFTVTMIPKEAKK